MIEASLSWSDQERFIGQASSRHAIVIDAGKEKTANSPMELVLIALCGCTASDVIGILRKKRQPFTGLEVSAKCERPPGYPAVHPQIKRFYGLRGKLPPHSTQHAVPLPQHQTP